MSTYKIWAQIEYLDDHGEHNVTDDLPIGEFDTLPDALTRLAELAEHESPDATAEATDAEAQIMKTHSA